MCIARLCRRNVVCLCVRLYVRNVQGIPKFRVEWGWSGCFNKKPAISLKRGKIGPRLPSMSNRKLHTRFRLVRKAATLDDIKRPLPRIAGAYNENLNEDRPMPSAAKM